MFATAGGPSSAGSPLTWSLFFARQPEPDLEFTEEELEQTSNIRSSSPIKPPKKKKSGGSPLLWLLFLVLIGAGAYVAMEPEIVMDVVGPILGETPEPPSPSIARTPAPPSPPIPDTSQAQPQPSVTAPVVPMTDLSQAATPTPPPVPEPSSAQASVEPLAGASPPVPPTPVNQGTPELNGQMATAPASQAPPPMPEIPSPLFGEGQRVTLLPSPNAPQQKVPLMKDAEGTTPGPAVPPGTNFTILDGDLQDGGWVYYVRSDYGTKGWLGEQQLRAKR